MNVYILDYYKDTVQLCLVDKPYNENYVYVYVNSHSPCKRLIH